MSGLQDAHEIRARNFKEAALPHRDKLFRAARRVLGNKPDAEDVVQETYLQAWKSFDRFKLGTNCRAWLFKIVFHVIQHHRRKQFRFAPRSNRNDNAQLECLAVSEPPIPHELTDENVIAAFKRLPHQYREVMILADIRDFSYKEVAGTLNTPQGTVMSRLHRGRRLMRAALCG